jgi:hypothetical protein
LNSFKALVLKTFSLSVPTEIITEKSEEKFISHFNITSEIDMFDHVKGGHALIAKWKQRELQTAFLLGEIICELLRRWNDTTGKYTIKSDFEQEQKQLQKHIVVVKDNRKESIMILDDWDAFCNSKLGGISARTAGRYIDVYEFCIRYPALLRTATPRSWLYNQSKSEKSLLYQYLQAYPDQYNQLVMKINEILNVSLVKS